MCWSREGHPPPTSCPPQLTCPGWLFPASFPRSSLSQEDGSAREGLPISCRAELSLWFPFPWFWFCASAPQQETVSTPLAQRTLDTTSAHTVLLKLGLYMEHPFCPDHSSSVGNTHGHTRAWTHLDLHSYTEACTVTLRRIHSAHALTHSPSQGLGQPLEITCAQHQAQHFSEQLVTWWTGPSIHQNLRHITGEKEHPFSISFISPQQGRGVQDS